MTRNELLRAKIITVTQLRRDIFRIVKSKKVHIVMQGKRQMVLVPYLKMVNLVLAVNS